MKEEPKTREYQNVCSKCGKRGMIVDNLCGGCRAEATSKLCKATGIVSEEEDVSGKKNSGGAGAGGRSGTAKNTKKKKIVSDSGVV